MRTQADAPTTVKDMVHINNSLASITDCRIYRSGDDRLKPGMCLIRIGVLASIVHDRRSVVTKSVLARPQGLRVFYAQFPRLSLRSGNPQASVLPRPGRPRACLV